MIFMSGLLCAACSEDEESVGGGSISEVENPLLNEGNMLLTSLKCIHNGSYLSCNYKFLYDEKLRLYRIEDDDAVFYAIDYDKGKCLEWGDDYDSSNNLSVSFNSKGYIATIKGSWDFSDDDERECGSMEWVANYDMDRHLTEVVAEETDVASGNIKSFWKTTLDWKDGCLMSISSNYGMENIILSNQAKIFTYGDQKNRFKQYIGEISLVDEYCFAGLLGVGPDLLPITEKWVWNDGFSNIGGKTCNATYTLNADGSIDTETWSEQDNYTWKYVFGYTASDAISATKTRCSYMQPWMTSADKARKIKEFMSKLPFTSKRRNGK